jgi:hypothetical protein
MKHLLFLSLILFTIPLEAQNKYLLFEENFDNNQNNWLLGDRAKTNAYIQNGFFYLEGKRPNYNYSRRIEQGYLREHQDFEIEIRLKQIAGTNSRGYALEWGGNSLMNTFYEFWLRNDGSYSIDKFDGSTRKFTDYVAWTPSNLVKINDFNVLKVRKIGQKLQCFINEKAVFETDFPKLYGNEIGFIVPPLSTVEVDYLKINTLNKAPEPVFDKKKTPNIRVVMVGVADYQNDNDTHLEDLQFTVNDVKELEKFYRSPNGGAVLDENMTVLIDKQASKQNILQALESTFGKAEPNDLVVFYFSGHGFAPKEFNKQLHLLPYDYAIGKQATAIHYQEIEKIFEACKADKKLWVMDACHSGAVGVNCGEGSSIAECLSHVNTIDIALLTSANAGETSLEIGDELKRGLFSYYLTQGLVQDAKSVDLNGDKLVSILELFQYVQLQTSKNAQIHKLGHQQHPQIIGKVPVQLPLSEVK